MSKKSISFQEARDFTRKLGLKSYSQWRKYCNGGNKPDGVPCEPSQVYKNNGWVSYSDWLDYDGPTKEIFHRKYYVNHDFFKTWSSDMAYILGFWWADGNMDQSKKYFTILLQTKDGYMLENFLKAMNSNYKINTRFNNGFEYKYVSIYSPEINKDIETIGGCPNKTKIIKFPSIPQKYVCDFIRGYWDGDGTIIKGKVSYYSKIVSSSHDLIYGLKTSLESNIKNIKATISIANKKYYILRLNGKNTKRLYKFMYPHKTSLKLERKWQLFKKHYKMYKEQRGIETKFLSFEEGKRFAKAHCFLSSSRWYDFCKSSKFPLNIPKNPRQAYKLEWKGWRDFLGTKDIYKTNYSNCPIKVSL